LGDLESEGCASPLRARGERPYLEKISTAAGLPHDKSLWKAVTMPDLSHTGLMPMRPLLRPDGTASQELKDTIATKLTQLPVLPSKDVKDRTPKRLLSPGRRWRPPSSSLQKKKTKKKTEDDDDLVETLADAVFRGEKKPYSLASLSAMMLDSEFGEASFVPTEETLRQHQPPGLAWGLGRP